MKKFIWPVASIILVSAFPVLFLYFNNAGEANLSETIKPLIIFDAVGMGLFLLSALLTRSVAKGAVCAIPFILLFQNYVGVEALIIKVLPNLKLWHILPILIAFLIHLLWILLRKLPEKAMSSIALVITLAFGTLVLFNLVVATPTLFKKIQIENVDRGGNSLKATVNQKKLPNIYYMVFDEYSAFDIIEKYFGYDNNTFAQQLEERGFTVSRDSTNESSITKTVVANCLNLDYLVNDKMLDSEKAHYYSDPYLFRLMRSNGYTNRILGNPERFGNFQSVLTSKASSHSAKTVAGEDFSTLLLEKTVFNPFINKSTFEQARIIEDSEKYMCNPKNFQSGPFFTWLYLVCPHQPFVFKADGSYNNLENINNWNDKEYYLGAYIDATNRIKRIVDSILKNDPDSIIIIQSDHSARYLLDDSEKYIITSSDRKHILNCVYYRGESINEIKGQSGTNTLRLVFRKLLNIDMPVLEVPNNGK